ncbi:MAG: hypothetical protein A3G99_01155 [Candidatus Zambryskibacteria bacterium RIFCSPLOWO2_12_FULL_39_23]|uniref:Uncharacterized protein n=1 Tax=Candidatus Zambryskibacteria bacterium RIFCSPLOWO2_12_FULL_39_23 TaxID=1802776 RepID=A0A1G2UV34_9BACT|nr:MAG: hypothetical protein A3G99_01155 [Candidatus Zambryskibacteria bacterium RIFCSPLOWO2_12_FULL_39_23]
MGLDAQNQGAGLPQDKGVGFIAEEVLVDILRNRLPDMSVRLSTSGEDSGLEQIGRGDQIDTVAYLKDRPAMTMQITTARDKRVRDEKIKSLRDRPFVRLDEMGLKDTAIPKTLVWMDPEKVLAFVNSGDPSITESLLDEVFMGIINSLKFDLAMTKNPAEQQHIMMLLQLFEQKTNPN